MGEKEFKKWLEKLDSEISSQELDLEKLEISANKGKISTLLSRIPKKTEENKGKNRKKQGKIENFSKTLKGVERTNEVQLNPELKFNPAISKRSQEIARKLEPAASRIFAPRSRNSFENFPIFERTSSSMQSKTQSVSLVDIGKSTKRMFEWNKTRIERIKKNQEERCKKDLETCTFKPSIIGKVCLKEEDLKPSKTLRKGYSGKVLIKNTKTEPSDLVEHAEQAPDLDITEYEHAIKRLHWELESLYLAS